VIDSKLLDVMVKVADGWMVRSSQETENVQISIHASPRILCLFH
jgi:hypothetical protein